MSFEINYNNIMDEQEKREKAIKDMRDYVDGGLFNILCTIAMESVKYRQLSFNCAFAGVQGYPVAALWDTTRQEMRDMCN